jgi:hypothetical protein
MRVIDEEGNALIVRRALRQLMATGAFGPGCRSASGVRWLGSGYEADVFAFSLAPAPRPVECAGAAPLRRSGCGRRHRDGPAAFGVPTSSQSSVRAGGGADAESDQKYFFRFSV